MVKKRQAKNILVGLIYAIILAVLVVWASPMLASAATVSCPAMLNRQFANLMDEPVSLCQFQGKVLLVVNTASECGYTPQYDGLEKLYHRYHDKGFAVLGFPANDCASQGR
jgi:glutathione peroxidase